MILSLGFRINILLMRSVSCGLAVLSNRATPSMEVLFLFFLFVLKPSSLNLLAPFFQVYY